MAKKDRMKNGLDILFEDNFSEEPESLQGVQTLRISMIEPDKKQPRTNFNDEKLKELADNIAQHGVLQPILVRPGINDSYKIVAGERRWRAARMAGLTEIPVIIRELDDFQTAQISLIENLQREDLDPIEEAAAYKRLMEEFSMTQEQLSESVGRSRSAIANSVRLLNLPQDAQNALRDGKISVGQAKVLCGVEDELLKSSMLSLAISGYTVRELEEELAKTYIEFPDKKPGRKKKKTQSGDLNDEFSRYALETALSFKQLYGINASVERDRQGFVLKFDFDTEAELKELIAELADKLG